MSAASTPQPVDPSQQEQARQLRGSSLLLTGRVLALGINFVVQIVIIRYLSKSDYGAFAYALSIVALVQAAIQLGLDRGLTRYVPIYDEHNDESRLFGAVTFVVGVVTALGILVVLGVIVFRSLIEGTLVQDEEAIALLAILIVLAPIDALDNLLVGLLAAFGQTSAIFLRRYVVAPLLRLGVVLLLVINQGSVEFLAIGYVLAGVVGLGIFGSHLVNLLRHRRTSSGQRGSGLRFPIAELLTFSLPLLTTDLVFMALSASDVIMLDFFGSAEDVASLRAVVPMAKLSQVVLASFGILYVPFVARLFARGDSGAIERRYWQTATWVVVLTFPILITTVLFANELTGTLLGEDYASSATILVILALGYSINAFFGFNGMTLNVFRVIRFIVVANILAVVTNIGLNLALIPSWGPVGAAVATAATFLIHNLLKQWGLVRRAGVHGFSRRTGVLYLTVAVWVLLAIAAGLVLDLPFVLRVVMVAGSTSVVLWIARDIVSLDDTFPIVARLPGIQQLFRSR